MTLVELAERCEKATGPNRWLNNAIRLATNDGCAFGDDPEFTASLDAAMTLVPEGRQCQAVQNDTFWRVILGIETPKLETASGKAATFALALCAAALRARAAQEG